MCKRSIERTGNLNKYVQVSYLTQDGRAKAGSDYYSIVGEAVFAPGETSKTVSIILPSDDIYTGERQFGLEVSLQGESLVPLPSWEIKVTDTQGEQIRQWHQSMTEPDSPLAEKAPLGLLNYYVTANDQGKASISIAMQGEIPVNSYYVKNSEQQWIPFFYNEQTGTQITDSDGDGIPESVQLNLIDGGRGDADGQKNGIIQLDSFFSQSLPSIVGTQRNNLLNGTSAAELIVGLQGGDTLTGGGGSDEFYYYSLRDAGDIITDFQLNEDKINLAEVMAGISASSEPIHDQYIGFRDIPGRGTLLMIDEDGMGSNSIFRPFIFVQNITADQLNQPNNFVF